MPRPVRGSTTSVPRPFEGHFPTRQHVCASLQFFVRFSSALGLNKWRLFNPARRASGRRRPKRITNELYVFLPLSGGARTPGRE